VVYPSLHRPYRPSRLPTPRLPSYKVRLAAFPPIFRSLYEISWCPMPRDTVDIHRGFFFYVGGHGEVCVVIVSVDRTLDALSGEQLFFFTSLVSLNNLSANPLLRVRTCPGSR
jgi:hypothetical protein